MTPATEQTVLLIAANWAKRKSYPARNPTHRRTARRGSGPGLFERNARTGRTGWYDAPDGSRRRTPGGAYFYLVRKRVSKAEWDSLKPLSQQQATARPPVPWEDRLTGLEDTRRETGTVMSVKLTLVGRPGRIVERNDYVMTSIAERQTASVAERFACAARHSHDLRCFYSQKVLDESRGAVKNPDALLIVGGYPLVDQQAKSIAVLAQSVSVQAARTHQASTRRTINSFGLPRGATIFSRKAPTMESALERWRRYLRRDPTRFLLDADANPSVYLWYLIDVAHRPETSRAVRDARERVLYSQPVQNLFAAQQPATSSVPSPFPNSTRATRCSFSAS